MQKTMPQNADLKSVFVCRKNHPSMIQAQQPLPSFQSLKSLKTMKERSLKAKQDRVKNLESRFDIL